MQYFIIIFFTVLNNFIFASRCDEFIERVRAEIKKTRTVSSIEISKVLNPLTNKIETVNTELLIQQRPKDNKIKKSFSSFFKLFSSKRQKITSLLNNEALIKALRERKSLFFEPQFANRSAYDIYFFINKLARNKISKINKYVDEIIKASEKHNDIKIAKIMEIVQGHKDVSFYDDYKLSDFDNPEYLNNIKTQLVTIGDCLLDFQNHFKKVKVEELWNLSKVIPKGLQGQAEGAVRFFYYNKKTKSILTPNNSMNVLENKKDYKKYAIKNLSNTLGSVENELKASLFFSFQDLAPEVWLGKNTKNKFFLITEWIDGINVKDIIINAKVYERLRPKRREILKKIMEKILLKTFDTYDNAVVAYSKAILEDKILMKKIENYKELLNNNFAFVDDVQFIAIPSVNGSKSRLAIIDAGEYYLRRNGNPKNSKQIDFLINKLKEFVNTPKGESLPYINTLQNPFDMPIIR